MKKTVVSLFAASVMLYCGAAENYAAVVKAGAAAQGKRDYAGAIASYKKAAALAARPADKYYCAYKEYECLCSQRKYDEAIGVMQNSLKIVKLAPEQKAEALYLCGRTAADKKDLANAIKFYAESARIGKGWASARSLSNQGDILCRQRKYADAEKLYKEGVSRNDAGTKMDSWIGLSSVYYFTGKPCETAIAPLLEAEKFAATQSDNQKIRVIFYKGVTFSRYKKSDEALKALMKIKDIKNPQKDWTAAIYTTAADVAFNQKKDVKLAKELIDKSAAQKPNWGFDKNLQKKIDAANKGK